MSPFSQNFLLSRFREFEERTALVTASGEWTYGELLDRVGQAEDFLRDRSESVLLLGDDYGLGSIALLLAGLQSQKILAPVTTRVDGELKRLGVACGATGILREKEGQDWFVEPLESASGEVPGLVKDLQEAGRPGLVLFSSGITGTPKAMLHDFRNFVEAYRERKPRSVSILLFLLFDHIGGLNTLFGSLASGMTLVVPEAREPETVARLVEKHRVRILPATPTFLNLLLLSGVKDAYDLSSLRIITYGAEAMPAALLERVKKGFPRVRLIQTFGTSETGIARTVPRLDTGLRLDDPGLEIRVVNGELWLKSNTQVLGYLNEANERFTDDGWFRTGDAVVEEDDGSLRFLGRTVEIINVGGEKVYPGEVEAALLQIEEVGACRAYGVSNSLLGQAVGVEVVPAREVSAPELRSLIRRFARKHLARYKVPVEIQIVDEVRMGPRGKREVG